MIVSYCSKFSVVVNIYHTIPLQLLSVHFQAHQIEALIEGEAPQSPLYVSCPSSFLQDNHLQSQTVVDNQAKDAG
jgi:hypothetical protein